MDFFTQRLKESKVNRPAILVMEGDQNIRGEISAYLESNGYRVLEAANGEEGLSLFRQKGPALLLLAHDLPGMELSDGLKQIRQEDRDIPIVVISSHHDIQDMLAILRMGAWDFVPKSLCDLAVLDHMIQNCFEKQRLIQENRRYQQYLEREVADRTAALREELAERIRMEEEMRHLHEEMTLAYDETIQGWARAMVLKCHETEAHSLRVAEMTLCLASLLGVPEEQMTDIRFGALLHDVGKIGVPDAILLKTGPLTGEEWDMMRRHPVYAYQMLSPISYLRRALDIPYCHHERWDGCGYPRGLRGEDIPLAARIFSVVDVWDSLRSDRPYRRRWSDAKTRTYMQAQSGTLFDPKILQTFWESGLAL